MIACVVPSYIEHIKYLDRLLLSIKQSTITPDVIIIAASEVNNLDINDYGMNITLILTPQKRNRAMNLNIACGATEADIISVIDSDDMAHFQRFEYILDVLKDDSIDAVVHNFEETKSPDYEFISHRYESIEFKKHYINELFDHIPYPTNKEKMDYPNYANGHVSFRAKIFNKIKFNESKEYEYLEDSKFNRDIVSMGTPITYIENKLTNYIKNQARPAK